MNKICCSVQRIYNPTDAGVAAKVCAFLADNPINRSCRSNYRYQFALSITVNFGHKIRG